MPIVSNILNLLANSILVPTPSVQETITGSFILIFTYIEQGTEATNNIFF